MTKFGHKLATAAALLGTLSHIALASSVNGVLVSTQGKVMVSQGQGYALPPQDLKLNIGTRIMVGSESSATIDFQKCTVTLNANTIYTVPASPACAEDQSAAIVDGVFVTPASAVGPTGDLNAMIANYSRLQKSAVTTGRTSMADCLGSKISQMKALPNFWSRNPGVDPALTMADLDIAAQNCGARPNLRTTTTVTQMEPANPTVITQTAPIVKTGSLGGMSGSTMAIVGVTGAVALGLGAVLLLSKKDNKKCGVSGCA
jgi:hypothetical protein